MCMRVYSYSNNYSNVMLKQTYALLLYALTYMVTCNEVCVTMAASVHLLL